MLLVLTLLSESSAALPDFLNGTNVSNINVTKILEDNKQVFSAAGAIVGLIGMVAGYSMIFPVFAVAGFCVGGFMSYEVVLHFAAGWQYEAYTAIAALVVGGIVGGALMYNVVVFGVFGTGAALGVALTYALNPIFLQQAFPEAGNIPLIVTGILLACIFGSLTLYLEKPVLIAATSFGGAFGIINGVNVFFGKQLAKHLATTTDYHWAMFGVWILISLIGMVVQFKITAAEKESQWYIKKKKPEANPFSRKEINGAPVTVVSYQNLERGYGY